MTQRERISGLLLPLAGKGIFFCLGWGCGGVLRADYLQVQLVSFLAFSFLLSSEPSVGPDLFGLPSPLPKWETVLVELMGLKAVRILI